MNRDLYNDDDDDDPGVIPPVRHINTRSFEDKYREESCETPFDEMRKEEQLKELDEIVAKITSSSPSASTVVSTVAVTPTSSPPPFHHSGQSQSPNIDFSISRSVESPTPIRTTTAATTTNTSRVPSESQRANDAIDRMEHYIATACGGSMLADHPDDTTTGNIVSPTSTNGDDQISSDHMKKKRVDFSSDQNWRSSQERNSMMDRNGSDDMITGENYKTIIPDRRSSDDDDRSRVDSILTIQEDEDDADNDEDEDDYDDLAEEDIGEEIARECSPVNSCLSEVGTMAGEIYHSVEGNISCTEPPTNDGTMEIGTLNSILTTSSPSEARESEAINTNQDDERFNQTSSFSFWSKHAKENERSESTSNFQPYLSREIGDYPSEEEEAAVVVQDEEMKEDTNGIAASDDDMILQQPIRLVSLASLLGNAAKDSDYEEEIADRELDFSLTETDHHVEKNNMTASEVVVQEEPKDVTTTTAINTVEPISSNPEDADTLPRTMEPKKDSYDYYSMIWETTRKAAAISNSEIAEETNNTAPSETDIQDTPNPSPQENVEKNEVLESSDPIAERTTTIEQNVNLEEINKQSNSASIHSLRDELELQENDAEVAHDQPHLHSGISDTTSNHSYEDEEGFFTAAKKESNPYGENLDFLTHASFGASLLGLGPKFSATNLSDMPQDERLNPPEGVDAYTNTGIYRPTTSTSTFTYIGEPYLLHHTESNSSREQMDTDDVVRKLSDGVNISQDSTLVTEANDSREEDDLEAVSYEERFMDEEQSPISVSSKANDDKKSDRNPIFSKKRWSRKCYLYFAGGCILVIILMVIAIVFGTNKNESSKSVNNNNNATPDSNKPESPQEKRAIAVRDLLLSTSMMEGDSSQLLLLLTKEKDSAEYKAMTWIIDDDPLALDPTNESTQNTDRIMQRFALATLYFASLNQQWAKTTNWLNEEECTWYGVTCKDNVLVTQVNMTANTVAGTLSNEISRLSNLKELILKENMLEGSIPSLIGKMSRLRVLDLQDNSIRGRLDELELSDMANLEVLDLRENQILGSIPKSLYSLTQLKEVYLQANTIVGTLSTLIGNLVKLERLVLKANAFIGSLPTQIGTLRSMTTFDISYNEFSGPIPTHIGNMQSLRLFVADENKFSGDVPAGLGSLSNIESVWLSSNRLTGVIRSEIGSAKSLKELKLAGNPLQGAIPDSFSSLVNLNVLHLGDSKFDEAFIPNFIYDLTNLIELQLDNCSLIGGIDFGIGNLGNLRVLRLDHNSLNDTIPIEIGKLTKLQKLRLESNNLSGEFPSEIARLSQLTDLRLNNNELESTIPENIGTLVNLERISMGSNWLFGVIPSTITNLSNLQILTCEDNFLTGRIPSDIGDMTNLEVFRCYLQRFEEVLRPGLVGTIPKSIGRLQKLKDLSLYQNGLTGSIPAELGSCTSLEILDLELNKLVGTVPEGLSKLSKLKVARLGGNDDIQNPLPQSICNIDSLEYRVGCGLECSCCTMPCGSRDIQVA